MSMLPRHDVALESTRPAPALTVSEADFAPPPTGMGARPLWIVSGQLGVILTVVLGFGVLQSLDVIPPKLTALALFCCVAGMIALGPVRLINKVVVSAPLLAFVGWWMASFMWTHDTYGWWRDTQSMLPLVLGFAVFAGLLPSWAFRGALVAACYLAVGYTVLQLGINPGEAMSNPDDVAGWRGGFIHKNAMAPFMLFAGLTIACFDRRSARRYVMLAVIAGLVVMSQSGTSIVTGLAVLLICVFLARMATSDQATSAVLAVSAAATATVATVAMSVFLPNLLEFGGKDPTLTSRTDIWAGIWRAVGEQPWLGYGAGGVWINPNLDPARSILRDLGFTVFHSHNGYLELLLLLGVIGLALFVWLAVSTMRLALAHLRHQPDMGVYVLGFLTLVVLISITEVTTLGIWLATLGALNCHLLRTVDRNTLRTPTLGVLVTGALILTLGAASIAALSRGSGNGPVDSMTIIPGGVSNSEDEGDAEQEPGIHLPRRAEVEPITIRPSVGVNAGAVASGDETAERLDDTDASESEEPDDPAEGGLSSRRDGRPADGGADAGSDPVPPPPAATPVPAPAVAPPAPPAPTVPAPAAPPAPTVPALAGEPEPPRPPKQPAPAGPKSPAPPARPAAPRPSEPTTTLAPTTPVVEAPDLDSTELDDTGNMPPAASEKDRGQKESGRPDKTGRPANPGGKDLSEV
jgi:O-antigen ligase